MGQCREEIIGGFEVHCPSDRKDILGQIECDLFQKDLYGIV